MQPEGQKPITAWFEVITVVVVVLGCGKLASLYIQTAQFKK
jgi:hypothetical protein